MDVDGYIKSNISYGCRIKLKSKFLYGVGDGYSSLRSDDADIKKFFLKIFFFWLTRHNLLRRKEKKKKVPRKKKKRKPGSAVKQSRTRNKT